MMKGMSSFRLDWPMMFRSTGFVVRAPDLVLDGSNCFLPKPLIIILEFVFPERSDERIFDLANDPLAICGIDKHPWKSENRRVFGVEEGADRVV